MFFLLPRTDTFFHNEKPGAISARAFFTALDLVPLYTYHVTLVYELGVVKLSPGKTLPMQNFARPK
jgi:hypothetical protein